MNKDAKKKGARIEGSLVLRIEIGSAWLGVVRGLCVFVIFLVLWFGWW